MSSNYKCSVASCKNNRYNVKKMGSKIYFHEFPECLATKQKWIVFCGKDNPWMPSPNNVVCSEHFVPSDYQLRNVQEIKRGSNWLKPQGKILLILMIILFTIFLTFCYVYSHSVSFIAVRK